MFSKVCAAVTLILLSLVGCGKGAVLENTPPVLVVSSIFPVSDLTRQLGGGQVEVVTLIPPGASPHTFEPAPSQMKILNSANLVIAVGSGLDDWLMEGLTQGTDLLVVTEGMTLMEETHQHERPAGTNPHVWLDPILVRDHVLPLVAGALIQVDPDHEQRYRERLSEVQGTLTGLDQELRQKLERFKGEEFISLHPAWTYFALRYGLEEVACVSESPGKEPTARHLSVLTGMCLERDIRVIVAEPQLNAKAAEVISAEVNARLITLDPLGGEDVDGYSRYQDLIRSNASVLADAFR